jgi:TonB family protein
MKQIHEYEADQAVLNNGIDARQYQLLLIKKSVGDQLFSMANNFNYQSLKKRIRMMTIKKSSRWKTLRALAVVPVIALALLAFANPEMNTAPVAGQMENTGSEVAPATKAVQVTDDQQTGKDKESRIYHSVEQMPRFPGGEAALMRYLQENIQYPAEAAKNNIQGRVIVQFVVEKDGHIGEVKVVRPVSEELDAEAVRVIKTLPDFEPGRQNGEAVAVWYTVPVSFIVRGDSVKQQTPEK